LSFFNELKRRNVFRIGIAYSIVSWLIAQIADLAADAFFAPDWVMKMIITVLFLGFPVALVMAWAYELTSEGLRRESDVGHGRSSVQANASKLDRTITIALILAVVYFSFDKFVLDPRRDAAMLESASRQNAESATQKELEASEPTSEPVPIDQSSSIAVLPFVNMSDDAGNEYFSEGLSEELLNLLVRIPELRVAARTSSFSYKGKDTKIAQIGKELGVTHVLEGSVRKSGSQIRITAQLIKADDGFHLWSQTYDRTLDNIFQIQDEIATAVVKELKITLLGAIPERRETDPEVHTLYLQGKYFMNLQGKENLEKAVSTFKQALKLDPDYAPIWTGLSWAYEYQTRNRYWTKAEGVALATEAAERALALDDTMALAWSTRSYLKKKYEWDWQGAKYAADKALQLEPNNTDVLLGVGSVTSTFGQLDKSIELFERAVALDPLGLVGLGSLATRYSTVGRYDEALQMFHRVLVLQPEASWAHRGISRVYLYQGNAEGALAEIDKIPAYASNNSIKAMALFTLGEEMESLAITNDLLKTSAQERPYRMATVYAWRGENDLAFKWLEAAFEQRDSGLANILAYREFDSLKADPRYPIFLEKLGLLEAWKAMPKSLE
jgi:TolB-like protein/Tfp pilus assembly protein PilF